MLVDAKNIESSVIVEDGHIILGSPLTLIKYGKNFVIEQIKWVEWEAFSLQLGIFLHTYYVICEISKLPDNLNDIEEFRNNIRTTLTQKQAKEALIKICKICKFDVKFIKKKFTLDDIAELFCYVYLFNIKGVKKNFKGVLKAVGMVA